MQQGQDVKQQIVERIKQSTSILVAVASNPSVDALSAALGLALMLNKLNKHTTAVFSGQIPPAIKFLEPDKTFENNVDALRDFIISLDKEKADRLRYKVEDNVVRIFITPYKTSITDKDLQYSQGDYNVDLIIALGVEKREELDQAIVSHGRILHDATVVTVNANTQHSTLGVIDWNDGAASSLCEMLVSLSEALQQPGLLDAQTSTAILTGIVASTERFSNTRTNPRVMTMAAQLMAAGANQQLIATNLAKAQEIAAAVASTTAPPVAKQAPTNEPTPLEEAGAKKEPGELDIVHTKAAEDAKKAEQELAAALPSVAVAAPAAPQLDQLKKELDEAVKMETTSGGGRKPKSVTAPGSESVTMSEGQPQESPESQEHTSGHGSWKGKRLEPPTLGGTLNATAEEALEESRKSEEEERNNMLFKHQEDKTAQQPQNAPESQPEPVQSVPQETALAVEPTVAAQPAPEPTPVTEPLPPQPPTPDLTPIPEPQLAPMPQMAVPPAPVEPPTPEVAPPIPTANQAAVVTQPAENIANNLNDARQAVSDALASQPFNPANQPLQSVGAQNMPAMPNMPVSEPLSQADLQALPNMPAARATPLPVNGLPPMPPMPGSATDLPPAPNLPGLNEPLTPLAAAPPQAQQPSAPLPSDPAQFKIPGA